MNQHDEMAIAGFEALLTVHGVDLTANTGHVLLCVVTEQPQLSDPAELADARALTFCNVKCLASLIATPRDVRSFTDGTNTYKVHKLVKSASDRVLRNWLCEQR
jgi:hypothetical protein